MPELPEVEITRRGVLPHVVGQQVLAVRIYDPRLRQPVPAALPSILLGRTLEAVDRRSRYLLFRFDGGTLLMHLGMTGSLRVHLRPPPRRTHDHLDVEFESGVTLRYHDPRRFGLVLWSTDPSAHPLLRDLGPEPFDPEFTAHAAWRATRGRRAPIKVALMDNRLVCGVGNIYASESLFRAGIRPTTPAHRISLRRFTRLVVEIRATLNEAIAKGGSTLRDFVDSAGEPGTFQLDYFAYGRAGDPCRVCAAPIRAVRLGGRGSFFCPRCQPG